MNRTLAVVVVGLLIFGAGKLFGLLGLLVLLGIWWIYATLTEEK